VGFFVRGYRLAGGQDPGEPGHVDDVDAAGLVAGLVRVGCLGVCEFSS